MCDIKMKRSVTNSVICRCLFAVGVYACSLILLDSVLGCAEAQEACPSKIHIVYDADVPPDDPAYQDVFTINGTLGQWSVADGELTLTRQADEDLIWIENNADFWKLADHGSGNKVTVRARILPGSNWDIRLRDDGLDFPAMHIFDNAVYFEGNYNLGYSLDATVYHDYTVISGAGMVRYLIDNQVIHESVAPDGYINVIPYQSFFQIGAARDTALGTLFVDRLEIETHVLQTCPENEIFLPKPGSILPDQSALFQWTSSETAEAHRLDIGTSIGAHDIFSQTLTGQTSVMVTGLPNADTWFYARLWTQTNGTWSTYKDYVYRTQLPHEFVLQADAQYLPEHAIKTFWTTGYCPGLWTVCSDAPEGQYCQHQEYQNTGCGWGIYYPEPQDLSVFEDGELIFYVRTTADLEITVSDPFLESHLNISDYGWINSGQWQLIRIPLADFGTDLSQVQYTFGIGYRYGSSAIEVDVDYVRWVRPYRASGLLPSFTIEPIANQDVSPGEELSLTFRPFESSQSPALSVLGLPEGAEFNLTHLTWTPASDKVWTHSLALIADDGSGDIMIKPFEIAVHDWGFVEGLHFEPLPPQSVYQGSLLSFPVVATDPHNEPLTYSAVQLPDGAVFDPAT